MRVTERVYVGVWVYMRVRVYVCVYVCVCACFYVCNYLCVYVCVYFCVCVYFFCIILIISSLKYKIIKLNASIAFTVEVPGDKQRRRGQELPQGSLLPSDHEPGANQTVLPIDGVHFVPGRS